MWRRLLPGSPHVRFELRDCLIGVGQGGRLLCQQGLGGSRGSVGRSRIVFALALTSFRAIGVQLDGIPHRSVEILVDLVSGATRFLVEAGLTPRSGDKRGVGLCLFGILQQRSLFALTYTLRQLSLPCRDVGVDRLYVLALFAIRAGVNAAK